LSICKKIGKPTYTTATEVMLISGNVLKVDVTHAVEVSEQVVAGCVVMAIIQR